MIPDPRTSSVFRAGQSPGGWSEDRVESGSEVGRSRAPTTNSHPGWLLHVQESRALGEESTMGTHLGGPVVVHGGKIPSQVGARL